MATNPKPETTRKWGQPANTGTQKPAEKPGQKPAEKPPVKK